jgi:pimeloyl-ACP methyl ester carboxylesterase
MPSARTSGGVEIAYRTAGSGPPDVLFAHGWAGSGAYFDETIAALDLDRIRVTTVDLSGHGDSPDGDSWSLDAIDAALLAVADVVGAERFVALGFSMSGKFVQHLALRDPKRIAGLMLVAGTQAAALELPQELLDDWYERAGNVEAMRELIRPFLTGPVDEAAFDRFCDSAARVSREALEGTMRVTLHGDFADRLSFLDIPTLVVAGARDELFTVDLLRATMVEPIPGARLAIVDCGHEIPLERPRELAALIEAFLAGLAPHGTRERTRA